MSIVNVLYKFYVLEEKLNCSVCILEKKEFNWFMKFLLEYYYWKVFEVI